MKTLKQNEISILMAALANYQNCLIKEHKHCEDFENRISLSKHVQEVEDLSDKITLATFLNDAK
jgi:hypothetical protein